MKKTKKKLSFPAGLFGIALFAMSVSQTVWVPGAERNRQQGIRVVTVVGASKYEQKEVGPACVRTLVRRHNGRVRHEPA
jgi:hypothetical protein